MNADRMEGVYRQIKGRVQQLWGRASGDRALVMRGKATQFSGAAQASFGRAMGATRAGWLTRRRVGA
ncbi:CsbD family protein [Hansschlegelia quercus]|uniref:CsbD family protein n=1 Tax=Hansschlegelia quercus TaxID=2528245 RepID=A0A4Q9GNT2_9HYPH|nr:CsbD family protein [Hansschlegelia quercus]TBN54845.1 CsbD family protein [Hansschlegelia quercus]